MAGRYKAYPDYKDIEDTALSVIPTAWDSVRVRFLLQDGSSGIKIGPFGSALKLEDMVDSGVRVYGQENVIKRDFTLGKRRIRDAKFNEMRAYEAFPADILLTMMGTSGKCEIVPDDAEKGIIDSHLLRLRVRANQILPAFFRLLIDECHEVKCQIELSGKGSIMHGLNSSIVKSLCLPLPSLDEQETILRFLDHETAKIDRLIAKQQELIALLKEKRQAVISHAVTKGISAVASAKEGLNPDMSAGASAKEGAKMKDSGVEWLGQVPEHWEVVPLKYMADSVNTGGTPKDESSFSADGEVEWFTPGDFSDKLTIPAAKKRVTSIACKRGDAKTYRPDSVLVIGIGATLGRVTWCDRRFSCNQQINVVEVNKSTDAKFLTFALIAQEEQMRNTASAATLAIMNQDKTKGLWLARPSKPEQLQIVEHLERCERDFAKLLEISDQQIELLQERRTALISAAVTGKIDVRNWTAPEEPVQKGEV